MTCVEVCLNRIIINSVLSVMTVQFCSMSVLITELNCKGSSYIRQGYQSPDRRKSPTFLDEIAGNMSNKCTFINQTSM